MAKFKLVVNRHVYLEKIVEAEDIEHAHQIGYAVSKVIYEGEIVGEGWIVTGSELGDYNIYEEND